MRSSSTGRGALFPSRVLNLRAWREGALFMIAWVTSMALVFLSVYTALEAAPQLAGAERSYAWLKLLAAVTAFIFGSRWNIFLVFAFLADRVAKRPKALLREQPLVSILVPCFNESSTIEPALTSLLSLDYPALEIIVVDDGSTDDTFQKASRFPVTLPGRSIRVLSKPNGGKWSALNGGFHQSKGELVLCVDADSRLASASLTHAVAHLADPEVGAVAGQVRVRNRDNRGTRFQALEYLIGNGAVRLTQSLFGCVLVVPGPIGLFRRAVLEEVWLQHNHCFPLAPGAAPGPFAHDTFAEDFDLSMSILCLGHQIVYEPRAVSLTKAPATAFTLMNQRYRWTRGSLQVLRKFFRRAREEPAPLPARLWLWIITSYVFDLVL